MAVKNIMIVGVGGQGTLLTSRILGGLTIAGGYDVKLSEVHGMAQRGGSVVTFVRYGDKVAEPIVEEGQADVIIAFERLEALRYAHFLKKDGALIVNDWRIDPMPVVIGNAKYPENIIEELEKEYKVYRVDATEESRKLGNPKVFNLIVLGVAAQHMDFTKEQWYEVIERDLPEAACGKPAPSPAARNRGVSRVIGIRAAPFGAIWVVPRVFPSHVDGEALFFCRGWEFQTCSGQDLMSCAKNFYPSLRAKGICAFPAFR